MSIATIGDGRTTKLLAAGASPPQAIDYHHILALLAAFAGLFVAAVLSLPHLFHLPLPCGSDSGCATVAASGAGRILGVPVAYAGVGAYVIEIVLLAGFEGSRRARFAATVIAGVGFIASAALLAYSEFVLAATCAWCVASGIAMTALFLLGLLRRPAHGNAVRSSAPFTWGLALLTAVSVGIQAGYMKRAESAPPILAVALKAIPKRDLECPNKTIGRSEAPISIVIFADLLCPACHAALASLLPYQASHSAGVRLIFRHQPLWHMRGHETSKGAAGLSEIAAEQGKFWAFAEAVRQHSPPIGRTEYRGILDRLGVDANDAEARLRRPSDPAIEAVERDVALATRLGVRATPTFIVAVSGYEPVAANQRTLPLLLNSPVVLRQLAPWQVRRNPRAD